MKLVKHEVSSLSGEVAREAIVSTFEEAVTLYHDCKHIYDALNEYKVAGGDELDLMDEVEPYKAFHLTSLAWFSSCKCSKNILVNKYLERVFCTISAFERNLSLAVDAAFCIQDDELDLLVKQSYDVVAGAIFFCLVEFDLFSNIDDEKTAEVDEIVVSYCQRRMASLSDLQKELIEASKQFHPKFDVFDANPEYEDEFQKIVGPAIVGIDESCLTTELVKQVILGEITVEELMLTIAGSTEEE